MVAILDTGCGEHPWFDDIGRDVVTRGLQLDGHDIGYNVESTDPETFWDQAGALDGIIDPLSGHGTFIAGLVHQACPDADILSWRVVPSVGPIVESDWITALAQIAELVRRGPRGRRRRPHHRRAEPVDGLLPRDAGGLAVRPDPVRRSSSDLASRGTLVVCSAGNDATARPCFPAAFAPWREDEDGNDGSVVHPPPGSCPSSRWVRSTPTARPTRCSATPARGCAAYAEGAAVLSTVPTFQGGLQPIARAFAFGRPRETIDPDDFRGGFGVWSGTSFAAPLMAGRLAQYRPVDRRRRGRRSRRRERAGARRTGEGGWGHDRLRRCVSRRGAPPARRRGDQRRQGPGGRPLLERGLTRTSDDDLLARIEASLAYVAAETGDPAAGSRLCDDALARPAISAETRGIVQGQRALLQMRSGDTTGALAVLRCRDRVPRCATRGAGARAPQPRRRLPAAGRERPRGRRLRRRHAGLRRAPGCSARCAKAEHNLGYAASCRVTSSALCATWSEAAAQVPRVEPGAPGDLRAGPRRGADGRRADQARARGPRRGCPDLRASTACGSGAARPS